MRMRLRLMLIIMMAIVKKRIEIVGESVCSFWVMPTDCVVRYMANDRYLGFLDLGRIDFLMRCGLWKILIAQKWQVQVITAHVRYKHTLSLFSRFVLYTRVIGADRKFLLVEQIFKQKGKTVAIAFSKCVFLNHNGTISTKSIFHALRQFGLFRHSTEKIKIIDDIDELLRKNST